MAVVDTFTGNSGTDTTGTKTFTLTVPRAVAAGKTIVLATERSDASGAPAGVAGITDTRGNTWVLRDAVSLRANVTEVALHHARITVPLQAGDKITVTWNAASASRKAAIAHVVDNLLNVATDATSGNTVPASNTNTGPGGLSASPSGSTLAATTAAADIVFSAVAFTSAGGTFTNDPTYTAGASTVTSAGSSDRALATQYRTTSSTGVKSAGGTLTSSTGWAMAIAAYQTSSNAAPTASVRAGLTAVEPGTSVDLTATGTDTDGTVTSFVWTQTAGPTVVLAGDGGANATVTYTAPAVIGGTSLTFSVTAIDNGGAASAPVAVTDTIAAPAERIMMGAAWVPARWGIFPASTGGGGGGGTSELTLLVTPEPTATPPRIRVDVTDTRIPPLTSLVVQRRNPDGHVYPVRTADGGPLPLSGGQATIYDYEPPYDAPIGYSTDQAGGPVVVTELFVSDAWLVHPGVPSLSQKIHVVDLPQRVRPTSRTLHQILGREDPVPISSGARPAASAVLRLRTFSDQERVALELLTADDTVLLLNIPPDKRWGWDGCYVSVGDLTEDRTVRFGRFPYREWTLPIQVVGRPAGGTQAAITWEDVVAQYPTWQAIIDAGVTSWAELAAPTA